MSKIKVVDFDYGCGGFTKGLEDSGLFEVVYNGSLNKKNLFCYNKVHKNDFYINNDFQKKADLAIFTPDLGHNFSRSGAKNFNQDNLEEFFSLLKEVDYPNVFFLTLSDAIPLLQTSDKISFTVNDYPTKDIICCTLSSLGYNVYHFVLDGAEFGMAQHKFYNIYWASKVSKEIIDLEESHGFFRESYRQIQHIIGDIRDDTDLTHHNPDYKRKKECSLISPGNKASNTKEIKQKNGFIRLDANKFGPSLTDTFYKVSSKGPSINPWYDRPLTLREGARLFGLTDDFEWDSKAKIKDIALMIYESFPPFLSEMMAKKIACIIKNEQF